MRVLLLAILILGGCVKAEYSAEAYQDNVYDPEYSGEAFIVLDSQLLTEVESENGDFFRFEMDFSIKEELFHEITTLDWSIKDLDGGLTYLSSEGFSGLEDENTTAHWTLDEVTPGDELNIAVALRVGFAETSKVNFKITIE
jgi:hypothetical protein